MNTNRNFIQRTRFILVGVVVLVSGLIPCFLPQDLPRLATALPVADTSEEWQSAERLRTLLREASDAELEALLADKSEVPTSDLARRLKELNLRESYRTTWSERALSEIQHRSVSYWIPRLKARLSDPAELELLTVLRRLEGKGAPLRIHMESAPTLECEFPQLPEIPIELENRDQDSHAFVFTFGGNYRSGRQARFRFHVRNAAGNEMPIEERWGACGGLFHSGPLAPGKSWKTSLAMNSFIPALPPGEYRVQIQYHNNETLANLHTLEGLVFHVSPVFRLTVRSRDVPALTASQPVREWLYQIPENNPLRIVAGTYSAAHTEFVAPDSPQGKILSVGLATVPVLIDELDTVLTPNRRAWIFSLLYSLTGCNDPRREPGVLSIYSSQEGGWVIRYGETGTELAGMGISETENANWGEISLEKQLALARRWKEMKRYFRVK